MQPPEQPHQPEWIKLKTASISDGTLKLEPMAADPDRFRKLAHDIWTDPEVKKEFPGIDLDQSGIDRWLDALPDSTDQLCWAVTDVATGKTVGITGMQEIRWAKDEKTYDVSRQLLPEGRGKGFGKRLDLMLLKIGRDTGFTKAYADVYTDNPASVKSRAPQYGTPKLIHDEDGREEYFFEADLKKMTLPDGYFLAYAQVPGKTAAKKI